MNTSGQKAVATQEEIERWQWLLQRSFNTGTRSFSNLLRLSRRVPHPSNEVLGIRPSLAKAVAARTIVANLTDGRITP